MNAEGASPASREETQDMQQESSGNQRRILYCHCAFSRVVKPEVKGPVLEGLSQASVAFDAVPDLCELAARQDPSLERLGADGEVDIVACYPRAVRWLFHAAEAPLPEEGVTIHNMREETPQNILDRLLGRSGGAAEDPDVGENEVGGHEVDENQAGEEVDEKAEVAV